MLGGVLRKIIVLKDITLKGPYAANDVNVVFSTQFTYTVIQF